MDKHNPFVRRMSLVGLCSIGVVALILLVVAELTIAKIATYERGRVRESALRCLERVRDRVVSSTKLRLDLSADAILQAAEQIHPFVQGVVSESKLYSYVMVLSPTGVVLVHSDKSRVRTTLPADVLRQLALENRSDPREVELNTWTDTGRVIDYAIPVDAGTVTGASVHLGVSLQELSQRIDEQQASIHRWVRIAIAASVVVLCVAVIITWRLIHGARKVDAAVQRHDHLAKVGELADGLVHEIRNPLNAMRMQVAVIRRRLTHGNGPDLDAAKAQLERLEAEVLRLQDLATDFLAYGKPEAFRPHLLVLAELVREVADFLEPDLERRGIYLAVDIQSEAERKRVSSDPGRLRQVLLNVSTNAVQAMQKGGTLSISLTIPSRGILRLSLRDTGCGIPQEKLTRVFSPFFSTKDEGNGLGLSITKQIVESHGGSINIDSEVGRGTIVECDLPVAKPGESGDAASRPPGGALEVNA